MSAAFGLTRSVNQVFEGLKGKDFSLTLRGLYHVLDLAVFRESGREECGRHLHLFLVGVWRCLPCAGTVLQGAWGRVKEQWQSGSIEMLRRSTYFDGGCWWGCNLGVLYHVFCTL